MNGKWAITTAMAVFLVLGGVPARAALISETISFNATNFTDDRGFPTVAPINPVVGSVTITFDTTVAILGTTTTGITLNNINLNLTPSILQFRYDPFLGVLIVANTGPTIVVGAGQNDFFVALDNAATTPTFGELDYAQSQVTDHFFMSRTGTATVTAVTDLPEPGALLLVATGLVALGLAVLYARRARDAAA
jgi:hypothetical protein